MVNGKGGMGADATETCKEYKIVLKGFGPLIISINSQGVTSFRRTKNLPQPQRGAD